ncbi:hypothetical protein LTR36_005158 [Oleoguttula mirabilis]|uniref:Uncharacterized protein n=1 Tax=Oleoguttula mirabilis TaxID=1507867 RepID=A0AAV9JXQ3_9PEZI|nr:hypothetical protein LTR36_005158 [Oleoguttula mirabilis]
MTASIGKAKMWHQLRLTPTAVEAASNDASGTSIIAVSVEYEEGQQQSSTRRRLHKLGVDVLFHDMKPPPGTPLHVLDVVHLALSISRTRRRKRRKLDILSEQAYAAANNSAPNGRASAELEWCDEELLQPEVNERTNDSEFDDLLLTSFDGGSSQDVTFTRPQTGDGAENDEMRLPAKFHKRASSMGELEAGYQAEVGSEAMLQLVDAAIRLAISNAPKRLGKGVRVSNTDTFEHLADIAPSLWSPGYLPAMSDRAVFLPTISHALKSIGTKSGNASLRSKITMLSARPTHAHAHAIGPQDSIAVRLWQLLQAGLYDGEAARRLKPLTFSETASSHAGEEDSLDMFDQSQQSSQEAEFAIDDDFDDFDDDFDGLDGAEMSEDELLDSVLYGGDSDDEMDNLETHQNELDRLQQLLDGEPTQGSRLLDYAAGASISECISGGSARQDGDDSEEDLLSVCGSIRSLSITGDSLEPDVLCSTDRWYDKDYAELGAEVNSGCLSLSTMHRYDDGHDMLAI